MDFKFRCHFTFYRRLLEFGGSSIVDRDIERSIGKCIFHTITDLIDQCQFCEGADYETQVREIIKNVKKCAQCQALQKNFLMQYFSPIDRDSTEEPIFQTNIKFKHGQLKFRATIDWALRECRPTQ